MSRFYKTSNVAPVDYMYRSNIPLMQAVLGANDQYISQELDLAGKVGAATDFDHLTADSIPAQEHAKKYADEIDQITKAISKNPSQWRKQSPLLKDVTTRLQKDYKSGPISKYIGNVTARKQAFAELDKQVELYNKSGGVGKDGNAIGISPENAAAYKAKMDKDFKGTNYSPLKYDAYNARTFMGDINIGKVIQDGMDKLKADKNVEVVSSPTGGNWLINKETGSREEITQERLLKLGMQNLNNPQLIKYMRQLNEHKLLPGVFNEDGSMISPYQMNKPTFSSEQEKEITKRRNAINSIKDPKAREAAKKMFEQQESQARNTEQLQWNDGNDGRPYSYIAGLLRKGMQTYGYSKTEHKQELSNFAKAGAMMRDATTNRNFRARMQQQYDFKNADIKYREKVFDEGIRRFNENQDRLKNPPAKAGKVAPVKPEAKKGEEETSTIFPKTTGVSRVATFPFESEYIKDIKTGADIKRFSARGAISEIGSNKTVIKEIDERLAALRKARENTPPNSALRSQVDNSINTLTRSKNDAQERLNDARFYYGSAYASAITEVDKKDADIYREFENDRNGDKLRKEINEAENRIVADQRKNILEGGNKPLFTEAPSELTEKRERLKTYMAAKKAVEKKIEDKFTAARRNSIDSDAIIPTEKESELISQTLMSDFRGSILLDASTGDVDSKDLTPFKVWGTKQEYGKSLNFDGGELAAYMEESGTNMEVIRIAPSSEIGNGNLVVEVKFNDPTGKVPKGKVYQIVTNNNVEEKIVEHFKTHANSEIRELATKMGNGVYKTVRNQMAKLTTDKAFSEQNSGGHRARIEVPALDGGVQYINVRKTDGGYLAYTEDENGNMIPLPNTPDPLNPKVNTGLVASPDDLSARYLMSLEKMQKLIDSRK